jgi:ribose transport system substrate-binding protein
MLKKSLLAAAAIIAVAAMPAGASAAGKIKIGFLPGVVDPFYQVMQKGVEAAAKDLGIDVVTQIPQSWGVEQEKPLLDAMVARGDLNYIISAPVDKDQMIGPFQAANDAGVKIITVDTFLGDGDYANGPVKFPLSYLGSNNEQGGRLIADGMAKSIGDKGTAYLLSTNPNVSSVGAREKGFTEEMKEKHPNITVIGPDYDLDDQQKATQMTATVIEQHPDLAGVFGTNVFSAQGAAAAITNAGLGGKVVIASWDATAANMENLNKGLVSQVLAQKPFDMGYLAVEFAAADAAGVTSIPKHVETGFAILDKTNESDPNFSRFIYKAN